MTWFKNLRRNSIGSWGDLCHEFTTHFTASRTQQKMVASLAIVKTYIRYDEEVYADNLNKIRKEKLAAESSKKPSTTRKGKVKLPVMEKDQAVASWSKPPVNVQEENSG
jgi:hypothetical protein